MRRRQARSKRARLPLIGKTPCKTRSAPSFQAPSSTGTPHRSGPLSGLTFAAKDLFDVAGSVTGCGNPDWAATHEAAEADAWAVDALLGAGATLTGKTITDEISLGLLGINKFQGTPLNPRAPDRVPGGSSSGSASAVAGGLVDIALGHRLRRLGAHTRELLRNLRLAADPWPHLRRRA